MTVDDIVFSQKELDRAVSEGKKSIILCDAEFLLPLAEGVTYTFIGDVKILSDTPPVLQRTSFSSSYRSSYISSYQYEYSGSFSSSYSSYSSSFLSSFCTSFKAYTSENIWVNGYGINLI